MIHLRRFIFGLLDEGKADPEIAEAVRTTSGVTLTPPRVANYRELYVKLNQQERQEFIDGKRDLLGSRT